MGSTGRSQPSRWFGIVVSAISVISAIWWMPFDPVWSLTDVLICLLVVYAPSVHDQREPVYGAPQSEFYLHADVSVGGLASESFERPTSVAVSCCLADSSRTGIVGQ